MSSHPDLAELAARALANAPEKKPSPSQDARAIALVAAAIRAKGQRKRRLRWLAGGVAAAASVLLASGLAARHGAPGAARTSAAAESAAAPPADAMLGIVDSVAGEAFVLQGGRSRPVVPGTAVGAGDQIVVQHAADVAFALPTGTRIRVDEGGDVTVVAQGATQLFRLAAGSVRADVQKLHAGERFLIRTSDAEIEVHGTSFRVANVPPDPSCGGGTTTRVSVYEGVVTVRAASGEASVRAGQVWPAGCDRSVGAAPAAGSRAAAGASATDRSATIARPSTAASTAASAPALASPSQLAAQNDLFAQATAAEREGRAADALAKLQELAAKYPSGPLAESAAAERMALLSRTDRARAVEAARAYLSRYPAGFARSQAEEIVREAGPP